jgi:hypothetical protein
MEAREEKEPEKDKANSAREKEKEKEKVKEMAKAEDSANATPTTTTGNVAQGATAHSTMFAAGAVEGTRPIVAATTQDQRRRVQASKELARKESRMVFRLREVVQPWDQPRLRHR